MPNVSFEERQGASIKRRIIAGLWIILALGGGIALVHMTPKLYKGHMEICYNEGSKGDVLSRVESALKKSNMQNISIDNVSKEKLIVSDMRDNKLQIGSNLLILEDQIKESIRAEVESQYATDKQEFESNLQTLKNKMKIIENNDKETEEYYALINEIRNALESHTILPAGWEMMFEDNSRYKSILNELITNIAAIEETNLDLKTEASRMLVLSEWISAPENQVTQITEKRVVHYEDTPELSALKDQKAALEASRMRLLKRATTRHPTVIKMSDEIDELQAQINALTRNPKVVEDIKEITNPKIAEFNSKIITTRGNLAALNSKLDTLTSKTLARLDDLKILVKDAQKDKDSSRRETLEKEIKNFQKSPPKIMSSPIIGYIISNNFEKIKGPNLYLIYSIAGFAGLVGAALIMYSTKKSSFKLEEVEATPEFPVLGKIGKIGGSKITQS